MNARAARAVRAARMRQGQIRFHELEHPKVGRREQLLCVALAVAAILVYWRTFRYDFVAYDDDYFIYLNPVVLGGLKSSTIAWAFGLHLGNWHPLTWLSYLLDAQLFGMHAGPWHAVNVLLHSAGTVLLFLALYRMTGRAWRCAVVAAIFALHPLHVESVAWVAERKDVLSTFFEMIALLLYARYSERRTVKRYLLVCAAFLCGLMAKPMLVTFPLILLVLDYWPLNRIRQWSDLKPRLVEKLPLLAMSGLASVLTVIAQREYGTVASLQSISPGTRIANAVVSYVVYIWQSIWPVNLAVLYPTATPEPGSATVAVLVLLLVSAAAVFFARKRPYVLAGWLWYLVMLAPVIGIIQVGAQSHADRYMYAPLIGLSIAVVWLAGDRLPRTVAAPLAALVIAAMAVGAWLQVGYWKDSRTLFEHTIAVTKNNFIMTNNLGVVLARSGDDRGAMVQYAKAIAMNADYAEAQGNLGNVMLRKNLVEAARPLLEKAVRLKPDFPMAQLDLGIVEASEGHYAESVTHLNEALRMTPGDPEVHSNLCYALQHSGHIEDAISQCRQALSLRPDYPDAQFNLRNALASK